MKYRKLTLEEHNQFAVLLEMTRLYNMQFSSSKEVYSTKAKMAKSPEKKITKIIDELKSLLDDQVISQYQSNSEKELTKVYYSRSSEAEENLNKK